MSDVSEHKKKSQYNKSFRESLDKPKLLYNDWYVVGMFYELVHYVEAFRLQNGDGLSNNHNERKKYIRDRLGFDFYTSYNTIFDYSWKARYDCIYVTPQEIKRAQHEYAELFKSLKPMLHL